MTFIAPQALLRGVFFYLFAFAFSSCETQESTPNWSQPKENQAPTIELPVPRSSTALADKETIFMVYNLRNYLSTPRRVSDHEMMIPKPEHEIEALIKNIHSVSPHILGVCEIGTPSDLHDLQQRLKKAGLDYPHTQLTTGADTTRRLALLSQFPLTVHPQPKLTYKLKGKRHKMLRGILDVSTTLPSGDVRFIGVHLKSKRPSKYVNQALVRRHEAELVSKHVRSILKESNHRLLLYGDFNDTKQSPTVRAITSNRGTKLKALNLKAKDGTRWTHYWAYEDIYSRLDYVFTTTTMRKHIELDQSYILAPPQDDPASDHRPLVISIR